MTPIKVGIVGFGKMGRIRASEVERHPGVELVFVADPDVADPRLPAGVAFSQNPADAAKSEAQAVFVCTPNAYAPPIAIACLDAGKHVFCEKPPGRTLTDIEAIRAAEARNPGLKLKFGFNHRYHAGIVEAKRIVESGQFGPVLFLRGVYGKAGTPDFERSWRNRREVSGGGILLDQGIHMLDLFRYFLGDFDEVKSMVSRLFWDIDVEDNAFALLRNPRGQVAMLHSSSTQWKHRFNLDIYMADGYLSVNGILSSTRSYGDETLSVARKQIGEGFATGKPREEVIYFDTDPSWERELADFIDAIALDQPVGLGNSQDALSAMRMVFRIYESDPNWNAEAPSATPVAARGDA